MDGGNSRDSPKAFLGGPGHPHLLLCVQSRCTLEYGALATVEDDVDGTASQGVMETAAAT
jgi:hypothetical protein